MSPKAKPSKAPSSWRRVRCNSSMLEYFHWVFSPADPLYVVAGIQQFTVLLHSSSILFWLIMFEFVRYHLPDFALYAGYIFKRKAFEPPPLRKYAGAKPLVSFIIAGRNPGYSIVTCIQSILNSNYKNVEVIFADDCSTDNSVALARQFESTGKVRVCANPNHSGKPANLNLAIMLVRGEFIFVLDSDSQVFPDTVDKMLPIFEDERVGAVSPSIYVRNGTDTWLTRFQEIEYLLTYVMQQLWRDKLGMITILSGMGTMFRTSAVRALGGYDMGLGDDTDITIRLRKTGWILHTSLRGRISTDAPKNLPHLIKQRSRWTRNMVKMRLRKHRDMGTFRYGFINGFTFWEQVFNRAIHPYFIIGLTIWTHAVLGSSMPILVGSLYLFTTSALTLKFLMGHDMTRGYPRLRFAWLLPFYLLYRLPLLLVQVTQVTRELLMIKPWHPYVPKRIWNQIPHH
jgi:biofilm PGA synthesis N-glycosyltransferase PgaC